MTLNPAYFQTLFEYEGPEPVWPESFAIITAHNPLGRDASPEENAAADHRLETVLRNHHAILCRLTGLSPDRTHAEAGWAAQLDFERAIRLGREFHQDAFYFIEGDELFVSSCEHPDKIIVGPFRERCSAAPQG
jgi:hypothetical protein